MSYEANELPNIVDANTAEGSSWFTATHNRYPVSTTTHDGLTKYVGALRGEWSDPQNGAHIAAQKDLQSADNSIRASVEAHAKGDFHLAGQHLDAAALRIESADKKANAEDPAMMGVDPVHAAVQDYKRKFKNA